MAYHPFTIYNLSTITTAVINYIDFYENPGIQHSSDLSVFGKTAGNTDSSSQIRLQKQFQSGSATRSSLYDYDRPRTRTFVKRTGSYSIEVDDTSGIRNGFHITGGTAFDGMFVYSVTSATWLVVSAIPTATPDPLVPIVFYTSTNRITVGSTTGIVAGWTISGNGYTNQVVQSVLDSNRIFLNAPPTTMPTLGFGNLVHFRAPAPFIVLNNTTGILPGYEVYSNDNSYTGSNVISVEAGNVVMLSDEAHAYPDIGDLINFIDPTPLGSIPPLSNRTFSADYTRVGSAPLGTYTGTILVGALHNSPVVKYVNNFVTIASLPPPTPAAPTYNYITNNRGGSGGPPGNGTSPGTVSPGTCPGAAPGTTGGTVCASPSSGVGNAGLGGGGIGGIG